MLVKKSKFSGEKKAPWAKLFRHFLRKLDQLMKTQRICSNLFKKLVVCFQNNEKRVKFLSRRHFLIQIPSTGASDTFVWSASVKVCSKQTFLLCCNTKLGVLMIIYSNTKIFNLFQLFNFCEFNKLDCTTTINCVDIRTINPQGKWRTYELFTLFTETRCCARV